jgi:hypothetical protein
MAAYTMLWGICNLTCFITFVFHIMIAPFFPDEAMLKGVSHIEIGYIFSVYPLANMLASVFLI